MINLKNIKKHYIVWGEKQEVLKGINLTINSWDFVAIMWPSGSGKSTLMNIIGMLDTADSWDYILEWKKLENLSENQKAVIRGKRIWFVFQGYNLIPRSNAIEQVMLPLSYQWLKYEEKYERAKHALEIVWMWHKILSNPNQLSGWQQQRVAIARAIVVNPAIVLADEPTGALDTKTWQEVMSIFTDLNNQGKTIVLITHEPHIADYAKKTIHIKDGNILSF